MTKTRVFVSSTCYDLSQIRRDLEEFIESCGYEPVLSDSTQLAIPSGLDNIGVCRYLVKNSDLFVLVIGGRYGSTEPGSDRSITTIEYDTAMECGLPVFAFVDREVWDKRAIYRRMKDTEDHATIVQYLGGRIQDLRVFDLLDRVDRAKRDAWITGFDNARDIIENLRGRWSVLFQSLLAANRGAVVQADPQRTEPRLLAHWNNGQERLRVAALKDISQNAARSLIEAVAIEPGMLHSRAGVITQRLHQRNSKLLEVCDDPVSMALQYAERVQRLRELLEQDWEGFLRRYKAKARAIRPTLVIENSGRSPAVDCDVILQAGDHVRYLDDHQLDEWEVKIPESIPLFVQECLRVLGDGVTYAFRREQFEKELPAKRAVMPTLGIGVANFTMGPKYHETVGSNGELLIQTHEKLKHGFQLPIPLSSIWLVPEVSTGEVGQVTVHMAADNLPSMTTVELEIEGSDSPEAAGESR